MKILIGMHVVQSADIFADGDTDADTDADRSISYIIDHFEFCHKQTSHTNCVHRKLLGDTVHLGVLLSGYCDVFRCKPFCTKSMKNILLLEVLSCNYLTKTISI